MADKDEDFKPLTSIESIIDSEIREREKQLEKQLKENKYYQKHRKILKYIDMLEVFTISELFEAMKDFNERIARKTVSNYLRKLRIDGFLELKVIPTRFKSHAQLYWKPTTDIEKIERAKDYLEEVNQKPKKSLEEMEEEAYLQGTAQSNGYKRARVEREKSIDQLDEMKKKSERKTLQRTMDRKTADDFAKKLAKDRNQETLILREQNKKANLKLKDKSLPLLEEDTSDILTEKINENGEVVYE